MNKILLTLQITKLISLLKDTLDDAEAKITELQEK
jgi:hypothetical protein